MAGSAACPVAGSAGFHVERLAVGDLGRACRGTFGRDEDKPARARNKHQRDKTQPFHGFTPRSRSAFPITETEERLIAAAS